MAVTPNQSYLVKQMQWKIAAALTVLMRDRHANVPWYAVGKDPNSVLWWPSGWRVNEQMFKTRLGYSRAGNHASIIHFSNARWDGQNSDLNYGPRTIDQKVNERQDGKTKVIHNDTDGPLHVAYAESVDLTNSFSSSITKGVTLDVTKDASVDASVTVKGEYAGVGAEATVAAHMGVSESKQTSSEEGREKGEEGTTSESIAIDFDADPDSYYIVDVKKENEQTSEPFDVDGVMDFDFHLDSYRWDGKFEHKSTLDLSGVAALEQYVRGYDTDHPDLHGYWETAPKIVKEAINFVMDPENRRIQVSGINHASLDSNVNYDVEKLGDHVPDALKHLPVVSARNV